MKRIFNHIRRPYLLLLALLALQVRPAQAQSLSDLEGINVCEQAIQVTQGFSMHIDAPGMYFFTATTYDLPLHLYFVVDEVDRYQASPQGYGAFTCTGVYDNPAFEAAVEKVCQQFGLPMPFPFSFASVPTDDGTVAYDMEAPAQYRDGIALYGFTEEIRAWIGVIFNGPGTLTTYFDESFRACQTAGQTFREKDTIAVTPAMSDFYRYSIVEWLNDSVLFRWTGAEPIDLMIFNSCDFTVSESDPAYITKLTIDPTTGVDSIFLREQDIQSLSAMPGQTSTNFMAFRASESADLYFTFNPAPTPDANAIPLRLGETVSLPAGLSQLYCFPVRWLAEQEPMIWSTNATDASINMYLNPDGLFTSTPDTTSAAAVYAFSSENTTLALLWSWSEVTQLLWTTDGVYYYVQFMSDQPFELTPNYWTNPSIVSDCVSKSRILSPQDRKRVAANNSGQAYRIDVQQWLERNQDVLLTWEGLSKLSIWIMDTCNGNLRYDNPDYIDAFLVNYSAGSNTRLFTHSEIASWADRADADGYIYFRFDVSSEGYVCCAPKNRDALPTPLITLSDQQDNSSVLLPYLSQLVDVDLVRTLTPGMFNTLCLPFALSAEEVSDTWGAGTIIGVLKEGEIDVPHATSPLPFPRHDDLPAMTPVIIQPMQPGANPHFDNRTIETADAECRTITPLLDFVGILDRTTLQPGNTNLLFLQAGNVLMWPSTNDSGQMNPLRAYFEAKGAGASAAGQRMATRIRFAADTATDYDRLPSSPAATKFLHHGALIIMREGKMYNIQGQEVTL